MGKSPYTIQFGGLPVGIHEYEFEIKDAFFKTIENSEIEKADILIKALLTKQNNILSLNFEITGTVKLECDRCIKEFGFPVSTQESLVIKHGNPDESTDEIVVIPEGLDEVNVSQYIYEYIILAIPARRVPCEINPKEYECDYETLSKLKEITTDFIAKEPVNPMWEQLSKLKKHNKN